MTADLPALVVSDDEIASRLAEHAHLARGAIAQETARALARTSKQWTAWCMARGQRALPATADMVAAYVDDLAEQGRKPAGVRQAVWAIGYMHRAAHLPDTTKAQAVTLAVKRLSVSVGTRQRQAAPLGADDARLIQRLSGEKPMDLRDVALLLVMRDMLARRSEAVALVLEDVTWQQDDSASVLVRRSKTDQAAAGKILWLAPSTAERLRTWLKVARIEAGPIFRAVHRSGAIGGPLASGDVPRIFKRLAQRAGLKPEIIANISGHSARVGMAQDLVAEGEELGAVMAAGRWKTPAMVGRYTENLQAARGAVARFHAKRRA